MTTIVTKTIGPTINGVARDFLTLKAFGLWLRDQDVIARDELIYGIVYADQTESQMAGCLLGVARSSSKNYCIIEPAPGLGVNELNPGNEFTYGNSGIELVINVPPSVATRVLFRRGVVMRNFRIRTRGSATSDTAVTPIIYMASQYRGEDSTIKNSRFLFEHNGAQARGIATGENATGGIITDNLIVHASGNGLTMSMMSNSVFERNTVIRLNSAENYPSLTGVSSIIRDNIFIGCSSTPVLGLPTASTASITNNFTDTAITGNAGGFTVLPKGSILENALTDFRPKTTSAVIGAGSVNGHRQRDALNNYRGFAPDAGAYQRVPQPLPDLVTAVITERIINFQTITFKGTITGSFILNSSAKIQKVGEQESLIKTPTIVDGNKFEVTFEFLSGGNYNAPDIRFVNDAGEGPAATGSGPFVIETPVTATGVVTAQYLVGRKLYIAGTCENAPKTAKVVLTPAADPNGAVGLESTDVVIDGNKFHATIRNIAYGNYLAPAINFTNGAGAGPIAPGSTAISVEPYVVNPTPGINTQLIGVGQTHATLKDFATWLSTRDLVDNNEIVHAYVINDQLPADLSGPLRLETLNRSGTDLTHYCVISPAPGMSVNDIQSESPLNYGEAGIELIVNSASSSNAINIGAGVSIEGFRITGKQTIGATGHCIFTVPPARVSTPPRQSESGALRKNRIRANVMQENSILITGEGFAGGGMYDNYIELTDTGVVTSSSSARIERNTIVKRGAGQGTKAFHAGKYAGTYANNVFLGCGSVPYTSENGLSTVENNLTNVAMTTPLTGVTYASDIVVDPATDVRLKIGSLAIGAASVSAHSTRDIFNVNRGLLPDVGAHQLNGFISVPEATITYWDIDGTNVTISGTVTNSPISGSLSVEVNSANPAGASPISPTPVQINDGTFSVTVNNVSGGNYNAPTITFTNEGGVSKPATGGEPFSITEIEGNPTPPDTDPGENPLPPEVTVTLVQLDKRQLTLKGKVNLQNDPNGKVEIYFDSIPSGTTEGPFLATVDGEDWEYIGTTQMYKYTARVVATAFEIPDIATEGLAVLRVSNTIQLPLK